jgi:methionyl-tRNA formyltransferase
LLPAYRGAAPVQRALLSGDQETGVSVIHMTPRLDGGPIVASATTPILATETSGELEERLSILGVEATLSAIETLSSRLAKHDFGQPLPMIGQAQDASRVSKAPRLSKAEAEIDWTKTANEIDFLVRGMQPWPVAFTFVTTNPNKPPIRVAVRKVTPDASLAVRDDQVGCLLETESKHQVAVGCGNGRVVIERLQPAGKNEMDAIDFVRGHRLDHGTRFGK